MVIFDYDFGDLEKKPILDWIQVFFDYDFGDSQKKCQISTWW